MDKDKDVAENNFIDICNRSMRLHIDQAFTYYMGGNFEKSDEELLKILKLLKEARENLKKLSEVN